ncbi:MAG TPA: dihydrolipoamide acetyltransferase family protein [Planctomycetaceae bacterium]|jgi:pyruvate dehydrogenase E2 component (dihydrolipoamide acetyltransferase)|nr:dihydrolipoamide acetyltransferase family protein [Planctomycetaceae bacterium]
MPVEIKVPRLGWSMEEGTFVEWLKREGDFVQAGQPLFSIEGDKAIQDVEAIGSGILRISPQAPESGEPVRVGVTLAFLATADEADPFSTTEPKKPQPGKPSVPQPKPEVPQPKPARPDQPGPEVPRPSQPEIPMEPPQHEPGSPSFGSRMHGSRQHGSDRRLGSATVRLRISPRALRVADELGIDWREVNGSGRGGRIRERDVRAVAGGYRPTGRSSPPVATESTENASRLALRRTIAARMTAGAQSTAPVTLTTTADATNLVNLRAQFKAAATESETVTPGYLALITKLAAHALAEHSHLNQQWIDGRIETRQGIHIAVAIDTAAGLLAPVVRDVPALGIREIAARLADLTTRAECGQLAPAELTGGTFTISNLGAYGIDAFTPILNVPQCAILGLGRIEKRAAVVGEQIVPRDQMVLSLTFDHRIVDGAPAAKFLQTLRRGIENPGPWLVS